MKLGEILELADNIDEVVYDISGELLDYEDEGVDCEVPTFLISSTFDKRDLDKSERLQYSKLEKLFKGYLCCSYDRIEEIEDGYLCVNILMMKQGN